MPKFKINQKSEQRMRLLAFADVHGSTEHLCALARLAELKPDIAVCAGDLTVFEERLSRLLSAIARLAPKVILIHGNHEQAADLEKASSRFDIIFAHKRAIALGSFVFVGWGGGGFSSIDEEFESWVKKRTWKRPIVLITHAPPRGTALDRLDGYVGCKSYADFIKEQQVVLGISGHIHELAHVRDRLGRALLINPGPDGELIEL